MVSTAPHTTIARPPRPWVLARVALGLTQTEVSRLAAVERTRLSRIEAGRVRPTDEELRRLAAVLLLPPTPQDAAP